MLAGMLLAACSTTDPPGTRCAPAVRTAADVPVRAVILGGAVTCAEVTTVLGEYYAALRRGEAPGIGGGGPVRIREWVCVSGPATDPGTVCAAGGGRRFET